MYQLISCFMFFTDKVAEKGDSGNEKFIFKSSSVKVAIVKKKCLPCSSKEIVEEEKQEIEDKGKQEEEQPTSLKSNGLLSLCQQYDSDDDED